MEPDTNENALVPSPQKPDMTMALAFAKIISVTNPAAYHHNAETDLSMYIMSISDLASKAGKDMAATYVHAKKGFDIAAPRAVVDFLELMGAQGSLAYITVDSFTDKKNILWEKCDYTLQFMAYEGSMIQKGKRVESKLWYTMTVKANTLHTHEALTMAVTATLNRANLTVTLVKAQLNAAGARTGQYHIDFALANPEDGIPWNLLHRTRFVTLPILPGCTEAQIITMNINPVLAREGLLCKQAYCAAGTCTHGERSANPNKRAIKTQEQLRLTNKYAKGGPSSGYQHQPRLN